MEFQVASSPKRLHLKLGELLVAPGERTFKAIALGTSVDKAGEDEFR